MALEKMKETSIIEERQEYMVYFNGVTNNQTPKLRTAHFIKPTLSCFSSLPNPPKIESFSLTSKPKIKFKGSPPPPRNWATWVENLRKIHEQTWRKAGIFDAIMSTTHQILRQNDLILSLGEKWCAETNTFVFPWGEATVTLEDVEVLGGFPTLGESVMSVCSLGQNVEHLVDRLMNWRKELGVTVERTVTHAQWMEYFEGTDDELQHAALVVLWLWRFVFFERNPNYVNKSDGWLFTMAAKICCGIKFALAPVVLADVYKGLRLLKERIVQGLVSKDDDGGNLVLLAPLHLVQLWAWERIPTIAPVPRMMNHGEPRLARWESLTRCYSGSLRDALDSAGEIFRWRPYAISVDNWSYLSLYGDVGKWVAIGVDEKWELLDSYVRVFQLEGLDCVQGYHPHRVARQFGMDQDIPGSFQRSDYALVTWQDNDDRTINSVKLYVPTRVFQGAVTVRYLDWWKGRNVSLKADSLQVYLRRKLTSPIAERPVSVLNANLQEKSAIRGCHNNSLIEYNPTDNGDVDRKIEQKQDETLHIPSPINGDNGFVFSVKPEIHPCNEVGSEDDLTMSEINKNTEEVIAKIVKGYVTGKYDKAAGESGNFPTKTRPSSRPNDCNVAKDGNSDRKLVQIVESMVRLCDQSIATSLLAVVPTLPMNLEGPKAANPPIVPLNVKSETLGTGFIRDFINLVDDDDEEHHSVWPFESRCLKMEERLSELETEISRLLAARNIQ